MARSGRGTRSLLRTWTGGSRGENQSQYKKPPCLDDTGTYCEVREGIVAQQKIPVPLLFYLRKIELISLSGILKDTSSMIFSSPLILGVNHK